MAVEGISKGYSEWGKNVLEHPPDSGLLHPVIDGIDSDIGWIENLVFTEQSNGVSILTRAGTVVSQIQWKNEQQPLALSPFSGSFNVKAKSEETYFMWRGFVNRVITFYISLWVEDRWFIPAASLTQEVWQLSRSFAWDNITGVTSVTHPGKAEVDSVDWPIDYTPTPTDPLVITNVYLLDRSNTKGEPDAIQTRKVSDFPANSQYLFIRYPIIMKILPTGISWIVRQVNNLEFTVNWEEILTGKFANIAPGPDIILDPSTI